MLRLVIASVIALVPSYAAAQTPPPAVAIPAADIKAFIDTLPKDRVSDLPIRVADVGGYKVGVYGVFRPKRCPVMRSCTTRASRRSTTCSRAPARS